jgi:hypothetical protein
MTEVETLDDAESAGSLMYRIEERTKLLSNLYNSADRGEAAFANIAYSAAEVAQENTPYDKAFLVLSRFVGKQVGLDDEMIRTAEREGRYLVDDYEALNVINQRHP